MSIIIFIIGLSLLILIHELGHFLAAKYFGLLVEEFGFGFPPRIFSKKFGETVYSLNLLPFGGFVRIHGENRDAAVPESNPGKSFWFLSLGKRAAIVGAGVIMNFLLGWLVLSSIYMIGAPQGVMVTGVVPGTPAEAAGLMSGDKVLGFMRVEDFISFVKSADGSKVTINISRAGEVLSLEAIPRTSPPPGEGALGVALTEVGFPRLGFFRSIGQGLISSFTVLWGILTALAGLIAGIFVGAPGLDNFVGPVGIFHVANQAADFGLVYLLQLIGLISLNLVILNVLPVPALDGGRLFFLLIEKLKGSPIPPKREMWANAIGFALLLLLMVVITARDIVKLF